MLVEGFAQVEAFLPNTLTRAGSRLLRCRQAGDDGSPTTRAGGTNKTVRKDTNDRLQELLQVFYSSKLKKVTASLESHEPGFCNVPFQYLQLLIVQDYVTAGCEGNHNRSKFTPKKSFFRKVFCIKMGRRTKVWETRKDSCHSERFLLTSTE